MHHDSKPRTNPATTSYPTELAECWACLPVSSTIDDDGAITTTHEPGCQHMAEQRARFTDQGSTEP